MSYRRPMGRVENYTKPFLVTAFVNLITMLTVIWGSYGFAAALMAAVGVHLLISWIEHRRSES